MRRRLGICAICLAFAACAAIAPHDSAFEAGIVTRAHWRSVPPSDADTPPRRHTVSHITLHHGGVDFPKDRDVRTYLRDLQAWSRREKKWIDVPYHYVIDFNGRVYEGRPIEYAGDTNTEYDPEGHALIELIGNYEEIEPSPEQMQALAKTMAMLAVQYRVPVSEIRAHRDYSSQTVCPGKNLYRHLPALREQVAALIRTR